MCLICSAGIACTGVVLAECKSQFGALTPEQVEWRSTWRGPEPLLLRTVEEAIRVTQKGS